MKKINWSRRKVSTVFVIVCITIGWMFWSAGSARGQPPPANLSPELQDVVKLAQARMNDDVILSYVKTKGATFTLTADQIIYLSTQGVSQPVIAALQNKSAGSAGMPAASNSRPPVPQEYTPAPVAASATLPPSAPASAAAAGTNELNFTYLNSGLVAYYPLNGNANDASGHGHNGIVHGDVTFVPCISGLSAHFDGRSAYITVPDSPDLRLEPPLSLSAWLNCEEGGTDNPRILNKQDYELDTEGLGTTRGITFGIKIDRGRAIFLHSEPVAVGGVWTHVVAVYDGSDISIFVNGSLVGQKAQNTSLDQNGYDLNIGRNAHNGRDLFKGSIREVRIYNRAISPGEIAQLAERGSLPSGTPRPLSSPQPVIAPNVPVMTGHLLTPPHLSRPSPKPSSGGDRASFVRYVIIGVAVLVFVLGAGYMSYGKCWIKKLSTSKLWEILFSGTGLFFLFLLAFAVRVAVARHLLIFLLILPVLFLVYRSLAQCLATMPPQFHKQEPSTVWLLFFGISVTLSLYPRLRALGIFASIILLVIVLLKARYYKRLIEHDPASDAAGAAKPASTPSKAEISPVHTISDEVLATSVKARSQLAGLGPVIPQGNEISAASESSLARSSPQPSSTPAPSLPVTSLDNPFDPDEQVLGQYTVCAFGDANDRADLLLTNRCLRLVFSAVNWKIDFRNITHVFYKQESATVVPSMVLFSRVSICGPVPVDDRNKEWLKQNQDAIRRGEIGVEEYTILRDNRDNSSELRAYSYRLPEGWFFDRSGTCLSVSFIDTSPAEAAKLFARIIAIRDTGGDSQSYVPAVPGVMGLGPWLSADEQLRWQWQGELPKSTWWMKSVKKAVNWSLDHPFVTLLITSPIGLSLIAIFSSFYSSAPKLYLTTRRLIMELVTRGGGVELSDFPVDSVRGLCWGLYGKRGGLKVLIDGPQVKRNVILHALFGAKENNNLSASIVAAHLALSANQRRDANTGLLNKILALFEKQKRDLTASIEAAILAGCGAGVLFDVHAPGADRAVRSLDGMILLTRLGLPLDDLGNDKGGMPMHLARGEEEVCTSHLSKTLDVETELRLTNWRLFIRASPALASGPQHDSFTLCEVFIDRQTRISTLSMKDGQSALVISWGSDALDIKHLEQAFKTIPKFIRTWFKFLDAIYGAILGERPMLLTPPSLSMLGQHPTCLVLPATRQEAEMVAATLRRSLMTPQEAAQKETDVPHADTPSVSSAPPPKLTDALASPEETVVSFPCRAAGQPALLRVTNRRLVIAPESDGNRETWACPLQDLTQLLSVGSGNMVSVVMITRMPALQGPCPRISLFSHVVADPLFDVTRQFPSLTLSVEAASKIGALIIDRLEGEIAPSQEMRDRPSLPFVLGVNENVSRHFNLGVGIDVWVTTRRLVFRRGPEPLTWEVSLSDISGVEQQTWNTKAGTIRYLLPVAGSRTGDTTITVLKLSRPSSDHFDRSPSPDKMTGPPRPVGSPAQSAHWFQLLSLPATGPDGDALWAELGPLLAYLREGGDPAGFGMPSLRVVNRQGGVSTLPVLGDVLKEFDVPPPKELPNYAGRLIISRRGLTLWREAKGQHPSVQSIWHIFFAPQGTTLVVNRVPVMGKKVTLKLIMWVLIAVVPTCGLALLLLLFFPLWPKRKHSGEFPAIGVASDNSGTLERAVPNLDVGVPTPPAVLVNEAAGRQLVLECNEFLAQQARGAV